MRTNEALIALALGVVLAGGASAQIRLSEGPTKVHKAVAKASEEQIFAAWPAEARALGIGGFASLSCILDTDSTLKECRVAREAPANLGFGRAALGLVEHYKFEAAWADGKPVRTGVTLPILFQCMERCRPLPVEIGDGPLAIRVRWAVTPSLDQLAAAFPAQARSSGARGGRAILDCTFRTDGSLSNCSSIAEEPKDLGFGAAALSLAPQFRAQANDEAASRQARALLQIQFAAAPKVGKPEWVAAPQEKDFTEALPSSLRNRASAGRATLDCRLAANGTLSSCSVASEEPQGEGYGAAALKLSDKFLMTLWSADGLPTAGARVHAPITFSAMVQREADGGRIAQVTNPQWERQPTSLVVNQAYPIRAKNRQVNGLAIIRCTVLSSGDVSNCKVESERPADYGFGDAALRLSRWFRIKPQMVDGHPVMPEGAEVAVPVIFRGY